MIDLNHLIAGSCAGLVSTTLLHPLDLVKVRWQVNESTKKVSLKDTLLYVKNSNGIKGLFSGLSSALIGSTTSIVVAGTFFVVLAIKRDVLMVTFFIGSILNGILSKVLKKVLNQERPSELDTIDMKLKPSDNGMPSSHAMSLGFIGTFTALALPITRIPILLYVIISLKYRIDTNLHTKNQILVGLILGMFNGGVWNLLCDATSNPFGISLTSIIAETGVFNTQTGQFPIQLLLIPAIVGALVVGSVERRISEWMKKSKDMSSDYKMALKKAQSRTNAIVGTLEYVSTDRMGMLEKAEFMKSLLFSLNLGGEGEVKAD